MNPALFTRITISGFVLALGACAGCNPTPVHSAPAVEPKKAVESPIASTESPLAVPESPLVALVRTAPYSTVGEPAAAPRMIVVGENHAKVSGQEHLVTLLESLHAAGRLHAILVEGSHGLINTRAILDRLGSANQTAEYWLNEVKEGRLDGYEYFALVHPEIPLIGVEDMGAKARFEFSANYSTATIAKETDEFADDVTQTVGEAQAKLAAKLTPTEASELPAQVNRLGEAVTAVRSAFAALMAVEESSGLLAVESEFVDRYVPVAEQQNDAFPLVERIKGAGDEQAQLRMFDTLNADEIVRLWRFANARKALDETHGKLEGIKAGAALKTTEEAVANAYRRLTDEFAITANLLLAIGSRQGIQLPEIDKFHGLRRDRLDTDRGHAPEPELDERDRAMVTNSLPHLPGAVDKVAVLIIGSDHIGGITGYLQAENVPFIAGYIQTSYDLTEPWEDRAWERRRPGRDAMFAGVAWKSVKHLSQLLTEAWVTDVKTRDDLFQRISDGRLKPSHTQGTAQFYDLPGGDKVLRFGGEADGRSIDYGSHFLGFFRDRNGELGEVWDRKAAKDEVHTRSDDEVQYVFVHQRTRDGEPEYVIHTSEGERTFAEFAAAPPGTKLPKDVVVFMEPDEISEGNKLSSPFRTRATMSPPRKPPGGGGGGGDSIGGGHGRGGPWFSGGQRGGPRLSFTNNPQRSAENLKAIRAQDPKFFGDLEVIDTITGGLASLKFTPSRGDHAQAAVIVAENTAEFRAQMSQAAKEGKLRNKQLILLTCGDAFEHTRALREELLDHGVLMVWTPSKKVPVETGRRFAAMLRELVARPDFALSDRGDIGALVEAARDAWAETAPAGVDVRAFDGSSTWTRTLAPSGSGWVTRRQIVRPSAMQQVPTRRVS